MLTQTKKEVIYLENQHRVWKKKASHIKELLAKVIGKSYNSENPFVNEKMEILSKETQGLWEVLSDFSYDISELNEAHEIISHIYWRFSIFLPLEYIQLTLKNTHLKSDSENSWSVFFLKATQDHNFVVTQKQYSQEKIKPCATLTFHQNENQEIKSFMASPLVYLGEQVGVLGFATKRSYDWQSISEQFYLQLSKVISRKTHSLLLLNSHEKIEFKFSEFVSSVLSDYKKKANKKGIDLSYSFSEPLLSEKRLYPMADLEKWIILLAEDTLSRVGEPMAHIHFFEKESKPRAQIITMNSPRLIGPKLNDYLKERDTFPTIERKKDTFCVEIAFK